MTSKEDSSSVLNNEGFSSSSNSKEISSATDSSVLAPKKSNKKAQRAAKKALNNLDNLSIVANSGDLPNTMPSIQNKGDEQNIQHEQENAEEYKPTLFMLNNNAPQPQSNEKDIYRMARQIAEQKTSYGTSAIVLASVALVCLIFVIIALATGLDFEAVSGFFLWVYSFILVPIGIGGSVICGIIAGIFGIVAICKSHNRIISWVGLGFSLVVLAAVVIVNGLFLF